MDMLFVLALQRMWLLSLSILQQTFRDVKEVVIEDDTFTANKKRVLIFVGC